MNIKIFAEQPSPLRRVAGCLVNAFEGRTAYESVSFTFENGSALFLHVDDDTDELVLSDQSDCIGSHVELLSFGHDGPKVLWSWSMLNQNGYCDACQIELVNNNLDQSLILQFKAAASAIDIYQLVSFKKREAIT